MKLLPEVIDYNKRCYCSGMGCIEKNILGSLPEVYWSLLQGEQERTEDSCILMVLKYCWKNHSSYKIIYGICKCHINDDPHPKVTEEIPKSQDRSPQYMPTSKGVPSCCDFLFFFFFYKTIGQNLIIKMVFCRAAVICSQIAVKSTNLLYIFITVMKSNSWDDKGAAQQQVREEIQYT